MGVERECPARVKGSTKSGSLGGGGRDHRKFHQPSKGQSSLGKGGTVEARNKGPRNHRKKGTRNKETGTGETTSRNVRRWVLKSRTRGTAITLALKDLQHTKTKRQKPREGRSVDEGPGRFKTATITARSSHEQESPTA